MSQHHDYHYFLITTIEEIDDAIGETKDLAFNISMLFTSAYDLEGHIIWKL
ncbi:hypothetical protein KBD59_03320 [Candidatus Gracilibacteria bacterium]|nr:hypothetical protein [Candidatus Gracilibacteria bacterium]